MIVLHRQVFVEVLWHPKLRSYFASARTASHQNAQASVLLSFVFVVAAVCIVISAFLSHIAHLQKKKRERERNLLSPPRPCDSPQFKVFCFLFSRGSTAHQWPRLTAAQWLHLEDGEEIKEDIRFVNRRQP